MISDRVAGGPPALMRLTSGARVATPAGKRLVEELAVGDLVTAAPGVVRAIRWIGCRRVSGPLGATHARTQWHLLLDDPVGAPANRPPADRPPTHLDPVARGALRRLFPDLVRPEPAPLQEEGRARPPRR